MMGLFGNKVTSQAIFYFFSSNASPRYKRNVLDVLCYPEGHIFRLRYQDKYVSDEIKTWGRSQPSIDQNLSKVGHQGITIYAETTDPPPYKRFAFYPTREVKVIQIKVEGTIYYVDVRLGKFINYYSGLTETDIKSERERSEKAKKSQAIFQGWIEKTDYHPIPPLNQNETTKEKYGKTWDRSDCKLVDFDSKQIDTTQGYFLTHVKVKTEPEEDRNTAIEYSVAELSPNLAWESVVDVLSQAPSMKSSIFYLVTGFYQVKGGGLRKAREKLLNSLSDGWSTRYPLPMGENVTLKMLFYKSEEAWEEVPKIRDQVLEIKADGDAFAGISQKEIPIMSRYNEERIQIACKRVFDSVLAPITIELKRGSTTSEEMIAPNLYLLTQVRVPRYTVALILAGLVIAPFLFTLGPDFLKHTGDGRIMQNLAPMVGNWISRNAGDISTFSKAAAAVVTLVAGYFGFRRLPIGK